MTSYAAFPLHLHAGTQADEVVAGVRRPPVKSGQRGVRLEKVRSTLAPAEAPNRRHGHIVTSSGLARLPEQTQAEKTKERPRRTIEPPFGDEIEAAHRR